MHSFTLLFTIMLAASLLVQLWLAQRQIRHVRQLRSAVPDAFAGRVSLEAHQKAAEYTVAKVPFGRFELFFAYSLLLLWTLGGGLNLFDNLCRNLGLAPLPTEIL